MSLKIFYSDRIEDLAEKLKSRLLEDRTEKGDPFSLSQVVVPNANIAKWLQIRVFAKERSLCAGIKFPFAEQRLSELMSANLPEGTPFSLLPDNAYANAIMAALLAPKDSLREFGALAPLRAYVSGGDGRDELKIATRREARMAWQLAVTMAGLMDQYEVRRPEIVANWMSGLHADGGETGADGVEAAEAALARILWGRGGAFPADGEKLSLRQLYDRVCAAPPKGPAQTVFFFGHSTLSLLQVKMLVWLAHTHDVVFFHNNVCLEYWGDIQTRKERIRLLGKAQAEKEDIEGIENPLLRQWGVAGRETIRLLVELEEENDGRIDFEWECVAYPGRTRPGTVLGRIQESICRRTDDVGKIEQDASVQIAGAPGLRREVEMVYNSIVGSVWKPDGSGERPWPDCNFSDIAVLVPDMAAYRPMIEAVFDARGDVPYGLIDTTASQDSMFLAGFLALADLARRGLTRETLFAVLGNPCVQKALGFSASDVDDWRDVTAAIGAFDGFDGDGASAATGWNMALSRLRLARVAGKLAVVGEPDVEMPLVDKGSDAVLRFSEIVELLHRKTEAAFRNGSARRSLPCAVDSSGGKEWSPNWANILVWLMNDFLAAPDGDILECGVQRQIVQTLNALAPLPGAQDCEVALAAVEQFVGGIPCRRGGYLTHGVTIAGLLPMRPVPFRQIYVLGLGANGFPGRTASTTLDVRGAGWRLGDTTAPNVNRYLFLETLMSARDRLVLSYPNRDIEKDAELFPAGMVRELEEFIGSSIVSKPFEEFKNYPLLERGEADGESASPVCDVKWDKADPHAGMLPTYSRSARVLARRRAEGGAHPCGKRPPAASERGGRLSGPETAMEISAKELAEFLKSPLRAVLNSRLGIAVEGWRDKELEIDPPVGVPGGPARRELEGAGLEGDGDLERLFRRMQLSGALPTGFLGEFAKERFCAGLQDSIRKLRDFVVGFGVKEGVDLTSRQRVLATVKSSVGEAIKARYVAETPNWVESEDGVSVVVAGRLVGQYGRDLPENAKPVDRTLAPFMAFLMHLADAAAGDAAAPRYLRVGVVDVANGKTAAWKWSVSRNEAVEYLERLSARYLGFLESAKSPERYPDFTYARLARAIEGNRSGDWEKILESLTREEWSGKSGKSGFNNALVVELAAEAYRRDPSADELKELFGDFYSLPMSGAMEDGGSGGAE